MNRSGWILKGTMLCLGLGLLMPLSVPASSENDAAGTEEISWVFDDYGLLDEAEQAQLDQELGDIYEEYGYDAVLLISPDIGEDQDYRKYAAEFMQENDIGYGDTYEGMCISISRMPEISRSSSAGTRRMIFLQMSRKKCSTSARNISRQMIR